MAGVNDGSKGHHLFIATQYLIEKHLGMRQVFIICTAGWVSRLFTHGHMCVACYYRAIHSFRRGSVVICVMKFQIRKEQQL